MKKGVIHHSNRKMQMARHLSTNMNDDSQNNYSNNDNINRNDKNANNYNKNSTSSLDNASQSRGASLDRVNSILHRSKLSKLNC